MKWNKLKKKKKKSEEKLEVDLSTQLFCCVNFKAYPWGFFPVAENIDRCIIHRAQPRRFLQNLCLGWALNYDNIHVFTFSQKDTLKNFFI